MSRMLEDMAMAKDLEAKATDGKLMIDRIGGIEVVAKVHKIFYDKLYADPWLGQFFRHLSQEHLEAQQTDFIVMLFGGPKNYSGRMPIDAHEHIMISPELFEHRHSMLIESLALANIPEKEAIVWLKIDMAFKKTICKESLSQCKPRYATDEILDFPKPSGLQRAS